MADDVAITAGSGTNIAADERTINSVSVKIQRFVPIGGSAVATGQVAPTGTAGTLLAARETRQFVTFTNRGTLDVYIGPATVTSANGFLLSPGESYDYVGTALIQAITSPTGTGAVHYLEVYDA